MSVVSYIEGIENSCSGIGCSGNCNCDSRVGELPQVSDPVKEIFVASVLLGLGMIAKKNSSPRRARR